MTTTQMRAVLIKDKKGPVQNLYLGEAPKPQPGEGQLLVKVTHPSYPYSIANLIQVKYFALNRMDIIQREGM